MKIFESQIIIYIILVILILILMARISNNDDLIKNNSKDRRKDLANMRNARKFYSTKKTFKGLLLVAIIILAISLIWDFTSLEVGFIDYFATDIYKEEPFNRSYYLIPIYILVIRQIIIEVKVGDFLFKYLKVDEPVLEQNLLKTLLYKKKSQTQEQITVTDNSNNEIEETNNIEENINIEEQKKENQ